MINKNKAFTLAEVLITLSIIGVIAAMTIPSLINNVQDQEYKTRWKKTYAVLENAVRMVATNNGGTLLGVCDQEAPGSNNCLKNEMIKYLNTNTSCDANAQDGTNDCLYSSNIKYLNGTPMASGMQNYAGIILANGAMMSIRWHPFTAYYEGPAIKKRYGFIYVDTNGAKTPNQMGKDVFAVFINENSIIPYGTKGDGHTASHDGCDLNADPDAKGYTCAADCLIDKNCVTTKSQ